MTLLEPPLTAGAGPRVVRTRDDVLARFNRVLKALNRAEIRDALADALLAICYRVQIGGEYSAAQSDATRSSDQFLDGLAEDRGVGRAIGESNAALRERLESFPAVVTDEAIREGVNAILAALSVSGECELFDGTLDRWFVHTAADVGSSDWHSYVGIGPSYPDRLFSGDAPQVPATIPNSDPGGAWAFSSTVGRLFVVRVPVLDGIEAIISFAYRGGFIGDPPVRPETLGLGFYSGQGMDPDIAAYVSKSRTTAAAAYQAIVNFIDRVRGQSIRFAVWSDSRL